MRCSVTPTPRFNLFTVRGVDVRDDLLDFDGPATDATFDAEVLAPPARVVRSFAISL